MTFYIRTSIGDFQVKIETSHELPREIASLRKEDLQKLRRMYGFVTYEGKTFVDEIDEDWIKMSIVRNSGGHKWLTFELGDPWYGCPEYEILQKNE